MWAEKAASTASFPLHAGISSSSSGRTNSGVMSIIGVRTLGAAEPPLAADRPEGGAAPGARSSSAVGVRPCGHGSERVSTARVSARAAAKRGGRRP